MQILLKSLLKEVEEKDPLKVQIYLDMDGVLVDMNGHWDEAHPENSHGFKKLSGGYSAEDLKNHPELKGNHKAAQKRFWYLINREPNFWVNLKPKPDAKILWDFIKDNFKTPVPVILSAGQGSNLSAQKTAWIRKHIDPTVKVIIASAGPKKPEYIFQSSPGERITHVLVDDTQKNIDAWDNEAKHQVAILHTDAANSINQLKAFLPEVK